MGYYEKLLSLERIKKSLLDEKSRMFFDAKVDYMINRDGEQFLRVIDTIDDNWFCRELEEALARVDVKGIVIFGSGHDGKITKKILEKCKYLLSFFCDSDSAKVGKNVEGVKVISVGELTEKYSDHLVVLGSAKYAEEMYNILLERGFPTEKILYPKWGLLVAQCGNQYYDMFLPEDNTVFVDAGGYNGDTLFDFVAWTGGKYKKVYVFEPIFDMYQVIKKRIVKEQLTDVELYNNALWNKKEDIFFAEAEAGSHAAAEGEVVVKGISLDEIVKDEKVSYIKRDIEGSELNALKGAKNVIKRDRPRLAICIYHKPEDILELPLYILDLVPEYKFYIRHYCSCMWETVLYAEIPE